MVPLIDCSFRVAEQIEFIFAFTLLCTCIFSYEYCIISTSLYSTIAFTVSCCNVEKLLKNCLCINSQFQTIIFEFICIKTLKKSNGVWEKHFVYILLLDVQLYSICISIWFNLVI